MDNYGSGMIQPGRWIHRQTGKEIMVRDSFQDGDHLMVMTNEGQLTMQEFSNYIQTEDDTLTGENIPPVPMYDTSNLKAMLNQGIPAEDRISFNNTTNTTNNNPDNSLLTRGLGETPAPTKKEKPKNSNYDLINKVFSKSQVEETIEFSINSENWPVKELSMLVNVLDVSLDDISDYVIDKFLDKEIMINSLTNYLKEILEINK